MHHSALRGFPTSKFSHLNIYYLTNLMKEKAKKAKPSVNVELQLTVDGQVWSTLWWKKLSPTKFLKLSDLIEDIEL